MAQPFPIWMSAGNMKKYNNVLKRTVFVGGNYYFLIIACLPISISVRVQ